MDPVVAALLGVACGAIGAAILVAVARGAGHALGTRLRGRVMDSHPRARLSDAAARAAGSRDARAGRR